MKTCTECHIEKPLTEFYKNGKYFKSACKVCHRARVARNYDYDKVNARRSASPEARLRNVLGKCRSRGKFEVTVDLDYVLSLWESQEQKCALSGVPLSIEANNIHVVSIDRIDSSKPYEPGNIQLLSATVNRMKTDLDEELFSSLCKAVADTRR